MKFSRIIGILTCLLTLSACNSTPHGKLNLTHQNSTPLHTDLLLLQTRGLNFTEANGSAPGSGLIGAIISSTANSVANVSRAHKVQKIAEATATYNINAHSGDALISELKNAKWLRVEKMEKRTILKSFRDQQRATHEYQTGNDTITAIYSAVSFSQDFRALSNAFEIEIYTVGADHKADKNIYTLYTGDTYSPDELKNIDYDDLIGKWSENDGALIKKAVSITTANTAKQLREDLANPYTK